MFSPAGMIASCLPFTRSLMIRQRKNVAIVVGAFYALCALMCLSAWLQPANRGGAVEFIIWLMVVLFTVVSIWAFYDLRRLAKQEHQRRPPE